MEYDWRTRFHEPLSAVGRSMTYGEAWRLARILADTPGTQLSTTLAGWQWPADRHLLVLLDLYDLLHMANAKRRPPARPRPWDPVARRTGTAALSVADMRAALDKHRQEVG